ncbi:MAG: hypothetical protein AAGI53_00830 [Planctomycetota bacterium]
MLNRISPTVLGTIAALAFGTTTASAQLSTAFSYQGVLEDGGSLANGAYDLRFRLFDAEVGGAQVGSTFTSLNQAVFDGLIQQQPDFGAAFDGRRLWIEVGVRPAGSGSFAALPRREIVSTPNAQFAMRAAEATFALTSGTTLDEAIDNGADVDLGTDRITITDGVGTMQLGAGDDFDNNVLQIYGSDGSPAVYIAEDQDGQAGFVNIPSDSVFFNGFAVDGNYLGTGSPFLRMFGNVLTFFDMSASGNDAVLLPNDAISANETLDEAGLAFARRIAVVGVGSPMVIDSRTITPPADGFVVALATAQLFIDHVTGSDTAVNVAVALSPDTTSVANRARIEIESSVGTDLSLSRSVTTHNVYDATANTPLTVYLNAGATGAGTGTDVGDSQLTLIFVPTSYGTVSRVPGDAGRGVPLDNESGPLVPAPTEADLAAERGASIDVNVARMEAEIAAMKAEMEAMRAMLGQGPQGTDE